MSNDISAFAQQHYPTTLPNAFWIVSGTDEEVKQAQKILKNADRAVIQLAIA